MGLKLTGPGMVLLMPGIAPGWPTSDNNLNITQVDESKSGAGAGAQCA